MGPRWWAAAERCARLETSNHSRASERCQTYRVLAPGRPIYARITARHGLAAWQQPRGCNLTPGRAGGERPGGATGAAKPREEALTKQCCNRSMLMTWLLLGALLMAGSPASAAARAAAIEYDFTERPAGLPVEFAAPAG